MMGTRRWLATLALLAGGAAVLAGSPAPLARVRQVALLATRGEGAVSAVELGRRIRAREAGLRIVDLRPPEAFDLMSVPGAVSGTLDSLLAAPPVPGETVIVYGDGAFPAQAWVLLALAGHEARYLGGGLDAWIGAVMSPVLPDHPTDAEAARWLEVAELSRYFGGFPMSGRPRPAGPLPWMDRSGAPAAPVVWPRRRGC